MAEKKRMEKQSKEGRKPRLTEKATVKGLDKEFNNTDEKLYPNPSGTAQYGFSKVEYGVFRYDAKDPALSEKAPDRVGYKTIVITQDMVGKRVAVTMVFEAKRPGGKGKHKNREAGQQRAINRIVRAGGIGGIVESAPEAREIVNTYMRNLESGKETTSGTTSGGAGLQRICRGIGGGVDRTGEWICECGLRQSNSRDRANF